MKHNILINQPGFMTEQPDDTDAFDARIAGRKRKLQQARQQAGVNRRLAISENRRRG